MVTFMLDNKVKEDSNPDQPGRKDHHNDEGKGAVTIDGKQFSREEYQKMVERRKAGDRTIDIANDYVISRKRLNDKFDQQKIKPVVVKNKEEFKIGEKIFSIAEKDDMMRRRQAGETVIQIALSQGITKDILRTFFDLNGIKVETKEGFTYIGRKMCSNEQIEGMIEHRKSGESIESIAKDNRLSFTTLRVFFKKREIKPEGKLKIKPRTKYQHRAFPRKDVIRGALPKEIQRKIDQMKREGKSNTEIASAFNVGEKDLGQYFIRNKEMFEDADSVKIGADIRPREVVNKMIEARKRGEPIKDIALANGVKEYSLGRLFQRQKVVAEYPEGTVFFGQKAVTKEKMEEICLRRLKGETIQALANDLGLKIASLERCLQKDNITPDQSVQREINREYKIDHDFFKKIDSEKKAYLLGLIMTDGNIHKQHHSLRFDFQKRDRELCENARKLLSSDAKIIERDITKGGPQVRIQFNSKTLCEDLSKMGVERGTKTCTNKFPGESIVPKCFQRDFIRGAIDGDGSVMISNRKTENTHYKTYGVCLVGTHDIVKGVQEVLVRDAGLNETKIAKDKRSHVVYTLTYGGTGNVAKIFEYLYPNGFVPEGNCLMRKYLRMKTAHDRWQSRHTP